MNYDPHLDAYTVEGRDKCRGMKPSSEGRRRVYWRRAKSGRGTIYLYARELDANLDGSESDKAFGWIPEHIAVTIYLDRHEEGWANYYGGNSNKVVFTEFRGSILVEDSAIRSQNFLPQRNRHWVTGETLPIGGNANTLKEPQMANIDQAKDYTPRNMGYKLGENNKKAFFNAAYLEAGTLATKQLVKIASKSLPIVARGYADTPIGRLLLANIAQMAVQYARPDNSQLVKLTDAMVATAYLDAIRMVDLDSIIDEMLEGKPIKLALKRAAEQEAST